MSIDPPTPRDSSRDETRTAALRADQGLASLESTPALAAGDLLASRYRIDAFVARGGMGEVFRATDLDLGVTIALKTIRAELASDPLELRRFKQEVLLARSISHRNVCRIFDLGRDAARNLSFLTMEFLAGETLAARVRREGPMPEATRLNFLRQLAAGLDSAHLAGIVHRDFKSANVMLVPSENGERAVITDFGLAIALESTATRRAQRREDAFPNADLTTGVAEVAGDHALVGTPAYMSPEQVTGGLLGPASDLYALGVVLFEMATGTLPFQGTTVLETARARLLQAAPRLSNRGVSEPRWEAVIERLLAREPADRPASGAQVLRLLEGDGASSEAVRGNLPIERDAFVGRGEELQRMRTLLGLEPATGVGSSRLLSLLGVGGTGKSRLATHFAWECRAAFAGGAWFVDLSEARGLEDIAGAMARSLNVTLGSGDAIAQLARALDGLGECLVILDNFEQISRHAEATVGAWLAQAPRARVLVTTRERLQLRDEEVLALEPLEPEVEGLELFELRAQGQRAGFRLEDSNREGAISIVRRLDGLPLAIELAAARLRMLSLAQLETRLADRFQLLAGGQRGRQSTLRTTLDWSWDLLHPWEQAAVRQASLFEGGFTLEAAEAVIDLGAHAEAPMVLDVLQALLDKSWLRARVEAEAPRFSMFVTVQEYARAKFDTTAELRDAEVRHGAYFAELGREVGGSALDRVGSASARSILQRELDNIVAACRRAVARNDEATAVRSYLAAHSFLVKHGPWKLSVELGREVRPIVTTLDARAEFLASLGGACFNVGALAEARADLAESVEALQALGNHAATAAPRLTLGFIEHQEGNIDAARAHYEMALEVVRGSGNRRVEAAALSALGIVHLDQGRSTEAASTLEAAVAAAVEIGDRRREAIARGNLAILYRQVGKLSDARREADRSIECNREVGSRQQEAVMLSNLGNICLDEGRIEEAREAWHAALALNREIGSRLNEAAVLSTLGQMHIREGELDQAVDLLSQALIISREVSDSRNIGIALAALAGVDRRQGRLAEARQRAQESMALMRDLDQVAYASALCTLAEVERDDGNAAAAQAAFDAAMNVAAEFGVMPGSELANIIEATRKALGQES